MKIFPIVFFIFLSTAGRTLQAQLHEFGITAGGNNVIGDIGRDDYIRPDGYFVSAQYRRNFNAWYSLRVNGTYSVWSLSDTRSSIPGRQTRAWSAAGNTTDISALLEYNFLPLNPYKRPLHIMVMTPYLMIGLGYQLSTGQTAGAAWTNNAFTLPTGFGIKFSITRRLKFHYELLVHYTFSDNLDGSRSADNGSLPLTNRWSNDWFMTNGIGFSYGFGQMPCYINVF